MLTVHFVICMQEFDNAYENEVRRFVFSGPLTPGGVALRDVTITKKLVNRTNAHAQLHAICQSVFVTVYNPNNMHAPPIFIRQTWGNLSHT